MNVHFSSATDLHATPQDFFDALDAEFHFTLDVCATPENAKCRDYYTKEQDGLAQAWYGQGVHMESLDVLILMMHNAAKPLCINMTNGLMKELMLLP